MRSEVILVSTIFLFSVNHISSSSSLTNSHWLTPTQMDPKLTTFSENRNFFRHSFKTNEQRKKQPDFFSLKYQTEQVEEESRAAQLALTSLTTLLWIRQLISKSPSSQPIVKLFNLANNDCLAKGGTGSQGSIKPKHYIRWLMAARVPDER